MDSDEILKAELQKALVENERVSATKMRSSAFEFINHCQAVIYWFVVSGRSGNVDLKSFVLTVNGPNLS